MGNNEPPVAIKLDGYAAAIVPYGYGYIVEVTRQRDQVTRWFDSRCEPLHCVEAVLYPFVSIRSASMRFGLIDDDMNKCSS